MVLGNWRARILHSIVWAFPTALISWTGPIAQQDIKKFVLERDRLHIWTKTLLYHLVATDLLRLPGSFELSHPCKTVFQVKQDSDFLYHYSAIHCLAWRTSITEANAVRMQQPVTFEKAQPCHTKVQWGNRNNQMRDLVCLTAPLHAVVNPFSNFKCALPHLVMSFSWALSYHTHQLLNLSSQMTSFKAILNKDNTGAHTCL